MKGAAMNEAVHSSWAFVLSFLTAFAQGSNSDSTKTYYGKPVVVTGTREAMSERLVPATISIVTEKDLKSTGQISLLDALSRRVPDLFVAQRGVIGYGINNQAGTITIRGLGGSPNTQVLVMIDGIPQFMGLFGHPLPDSYMSEDAERVEVVRGPASVLYGTNAMGGVINIITKKNNHTGTSLKAGMTFGSYDTQEYSAGAGFGMGKLKILISGDHDQTAGHRPNSSFNSNDGYLNAGYKIDDNFGLILNAVINRFNTYDPGTVYSPLANNWMNVLRSTSGISLNDEFSRFDGSLKLYYSYGDHSVYDGFYSLDRSVGAILYQNYHPSEGSVLTIGGDYRYFGGSAANDITMSNYGKHYENESGVYALVEQLLWSQVMLNAGARLEHSNVYGDELVPQTGIAWTATLSSTLKASVSKGFRSPTIRELYLFPAPNPNLRPERLWNYEAGLLQSFPGEISLQLTAFIAKGSNLILTEGVYPNLQLLNSGNCTHKGIEFVGHYTPMNALRLDASFSYIDPGNQTYSTPGKKFFFGFNYTYERADIDLTLEHIACLYGAVNYQKRLPDYTLLGAQVTYNATGYLQFLVTAENLFNASYQTIYGYPMPGRTLFAGLNLYLSSI